MQRHREKRHRRIKPKDGPSPTAPCPCGSGATFVHCCAKQRIEWVQTPQGGWEKRVPLSDEAIAILKGEEEEFKELFGRTPGSNDLVFWRMAALTSDREQERQLDVAMDAAEVRPDIAYATRKTGLFLTRQNKKLLTGRDLCDWESAIEEFWSKQESDEVDEDAQAFEAMAIPILMEYERVMLAIGSALSFGGPTRAAVNENASSHLLFCTTRALRTLRALQLLTDERFGEDGLALVRSAYEGYLNIAYVLADPNRANYLFLARLGIAARTHEYAKRQNGRVDWTRIKDIESGAEYENAATYKEMARQSFRTTDLAVYEDLYGFLSTYVHPDAGKLESYTDGQRYDHTNTTMFLEARALGLFVGFFIVDAVCASSVLSKRFERDLGAYRSRRRKILSQIIKNGFPSALCESFEARLIAAV